MLIDEEHLKALNNMSHRQDLVNELLPLFEQRTQALLMQLTQALGSSDAAGARNTVHALKSTTSSMGARYMSTVCDALSHMDQTEWANNAEALVGDLKVSFRPTLDSLTQWVGRR